MRERKHFYNNVGEVWTTSYHITYEARHDLGDSIEVILRNIDNAASPYNDSSLVAAFNRDAIGGPADSLLLRLVHTSQTVHDLSNGAFDPTVMPLVKAWKPYIKNETNTQPSRATIDSLLQFVGMQHITLRGDSIVKDDPRTQVDFSAIAKGFACDEIAQMLQRNGVKNLMVEIGGEVAMRGVNSHGDKWHISVDAPTDANSHVSALVIAMTDGAVATSGNYRQCRATKSHIVDPRTGDCLVGDLLSATIVANDCMTADAWATACMVLGTEKTQQLLGNREDIGVMTISAGTDGNLVVWSNARFADLYLTQTNADAD